MTKPDPYSKQARLYAEDAQKCHIWMPQVEFHYKCRNTLKQNVDFICQMLGSCVKKRGFCAEPFTFRCDIILVLFTHYTFF